MRKLAYTIIASAAALAVAGPALADDNHRRDRHDDRHERLNDQHDRTHERLEDRHERKHDEGLSRREHNRLHDRLDRKHARADAKIERRHDAQHDRGYGYGYDDRGAGYGYDRGYDQGYGRYALRGNGWSRLGGLAGDQRLASWVLANFDRNRNGSLGTNEGEEARRAIHRLADRNRDGRVSQNELAYLSASAGRY